MKLRQSHVAAITALGALAGVASADRVDLFVYENADGATARIEMWVDVVADGSSVHFTFHNDSDPNPAITDIYFESGAFASGMSGAAVTATTGDNVQFSSPAAPASPAPPGASYGGTWMGNLASFDADPPPAHTGVDITETVTISFANDASYSTADVVAALNSGAFRIAEHIQSVEGALSVWAISTPTPGSLSLLAAGGLLGFRRRR